MKPDCDYTVALDVNPTDTDARYRVRTLSAVNGSVTEVARYSGSDRNRLIVRALDEAVRKMFDADKPAAAVPQEITPPLPPPPGQPQETPPARPRITNPFRLQRRQFNEANLTWSVGRKDRETWDRCLARGEAVKAILCDPDGSERFIVVYHPDLLDFKVTPEDPDGFWLLPAGGLYEAGTPGVVKAAAGRGMCYST